MRSMYNAAKEMCAFYVMHISSSMVLEMQRKGAGRKGSEKARERERERESERERGRAREKEGE